MSKMSVWRAAACAALAVGGAASVAGAAPTVTFASGPGPGFSPFTPSNADLLQTAVSNVNSSGSFTTESTGGVPVLTNGQFVINGGNVGVAGTDPTINSQLASVMNNAFIEYTLNTSVNTLGYTITNVTTYGGWNDLGRDKQFFTLSYRLKGSSAFVPFDSVDADNPATASQPSAIRVSFPGTAALVGVDGIRIDFPSTGSTQSTFAGQENGYVGLGEIDVFGSPTLAPEPGTTGILMVAAGAGAMSRRRR